MMLHTRASDAHVCCLQRVAAAASKPALAARPVVSPPASYAQRRRRVHVLAGGKETQGKQDAVQGPVTPPNAAPPPPGSAAGPSSGGEDLLSERLKALKEAQQVSTAGEAGKAAATAQTPAASNPFTAAAEESRLIAWPAVSNVLGSTAVVLGIVVASTLLILAVNSLLATASEKLFG